MPKTQRSDTTYKFDLSKVKWDEFRSDIRTTIQQTDKNENTIDTMTGFDHIYTVTEWALFKNGLQIKRFSNTHKKWWNKQVSAQWERKNAAYKNYNLCKDDITKENMKNESQKFKKIVRTQKRKMVTNSQGMCNLWQLCNGSVKTHGFELKRERHVPFLKWVNKTEMIEHTINGDMNITESIPESGVCPTIEQIDKMMDNTNITNTTVESVIRACKLNPGYHMDVMNGEVLRNMPQEMSMYIAKLCNKIIETSRFPNNLKIAQIKPVHKKR